jgi:hypothetical protein
VRPALESLEDRQLLSGSTGIVWTNCGDAMNDSDNFNAVFGANAAAARNVVQAALHAWNEVIVNYNYAAPNPDVPNGWDPLNSFAVTISMNKSQLDNGGNGNGVDYDPNGKPYSGEINIDAGTDGQGAGWFIDQTPGDSAEFRGKILNAFSGIAQAGSPALGKLDLFSLVASETAHAVGFFDDSSSAWKQNFQGYLQPTNSPDTSPGANGQGQLWTFTAPGVTALYTTYDSGSPNNTRAFPVHMAEPGPGNVLTVNGTTYSGVFDANNGTYAPGQRLLPSDLDARILGAVYGYTVNSNPGKNQDQTGFDTFYSNLDTTTGNLLLRGGTDGSNSNDFTDARRANTMNPPMWLITTTIGTPVAGTPTNTFTTFVSGVQSITIDSGDGSDDVQLDFGGGDIFPLGGITVNGKVGDTSPTALPGGTDTLEVDGSTMGNSFTFTGNQIQLLAGGGIINGTITYANVDSLIAHAPMNANDFELKSTSPDVQSVKVDTFGDDDIYVDSVPATQKVTVNTYHGYDYVYVGGSRNNANGALNTILGQVTVHGGGFTKLYAEDQGAGGTETFALTSTNLTRTGTGPLTSILFSGLSGLQIDGGKGNNTVVCQDKSHSWHVTGNNAGNVDALPANPLGGAGLATFTAIESLKGGSWTDTYVFANGASLGGTLDAGTGNSTLDFSADTHGVYVNLLKGLASHIAGGVAGGIVGGIENVTGGKGNDILVGDAKPNLLIGGGGNNLLIGEGGGDQLIGSGNDLLIAGKTKFDLQDKALALILSEWTFPYPWTTNPLQLYYIHISYIRVGGGAVLNGTGIKLDSTTVNFDTVPDMLQGNGPFNWFWCQTAGPAKAQTDALPGEVID